MASGRAQQHVATTKAMINRLLLKGCAALSMSDFNDFHSPCGSVCTPSLSCPSSILLPQSANAACCPVPTQAQTLHQHRHTALWR